MRSYDCETFTEIHVSGLPSIHEGAHCEQEVARRGIVYIEALSLKVTCSTCFQTDCSTYINKRARAREKMLLFQCLQMSPRSTREHADKIANHTSQKCQEEPVAKIFSFSPCFSERRFVWEWRQRMCICEIVVNEKVDELQWSD
jgi:hypothetical protein